MSPEFITKSKVAEAMQGRRLQRFALTTLGKPLSFSIYEEWIKAGHHAEMGYLERHLPLKEDPRRHAPMAHTAIVVTANYFPHPAPHPHAVTRLREVAAYARGQDYHDWLTEELRLVIDQLRLEYPNAHFLSATDSQPIMERDLAYRAGLGWFGKNSCLIDRREGSLFLIGEILTDLQFAEVPQISADHCGKCRKCIEACPTEAILENRTLDSTKCISYWTIESRKVPPRDLYEKFGSQLFGCDICQQVCPWNGKIIAAAPSPSDGDLQEGLKWILTTGSREILRQLAGSPLMRAGPFGLRRNALIVINNLKLRELRPEVERWTGDPKLSELAGQVLATLNRTS